MKEITNEQLFLLVIESGSFKAAAELLNTDPSSVSRKIAHLEKRIGVKLVERSTKRSMATESGRYYYVGLKKLLEEQQALENTIAGTVNKPSGTLKVAAPHDFGSYFVTPVLEKMVNDYSDLSVELQLSSQFEDLSSQGIDVAVRIGQLPNSSLICRRIGEVPRILVASKQYLEHKGDPQTVQALRAHDFIFYGKAQKQAPLTLGKETIEVSGKFTVNSVSAIRELVTNGNGIHLGPIWAFKEQLETGELVQLLPQITLQSFPLHALYVSRNYVPAKVRFFIERLVQHYHQQSVN